MAITGASQVGQAVVSDDPEARRRFEWQQAIDNNRDQWGRPKIMLPDGSKEVGYRRASSYGSPLEDGSALEAWKLRQVARGVARRKDLAYEVTRAEIGLDGSADEAKAAKKALNEITTKALDVVESGAKASIGTSEHHVFELVDAGRDPGYVPDEWKPDLKAYQALTANTFEVVSIERFVVQDDHQVGGTLDRAVRLLRPLTAPDGTVLPTGCVIIGDVKTAQTMDFAGSKFAIQCWVYSTGLPYDPIQKVRVPWDHEEPRQDWAVIIHVASGSGKGSLHWVDLKSAARAAEVVRDVYEWRNKFGKKLITAATIDELAEDFHYTCSQAQTHAELVSAYQRAVEAGTWNDVLKQAFSRRKRELEPGVST